MKYHFKLLPILLLSACSSMQNQELIIEKQVYMMSRQEVIAAIEDCKSANLRPVLFYGRRKVNDRPIPFIVDVSCSPRSGV
tara:strand:- start:376 stop:618 length:243 start_codon:yes stop_codon:yes gene_type:complete